MTFQKLLIKTCPCFYCKQTFSTISATRSLMEGHTLGRSLMSEYTQHCRQTEEWNRDTKTTKICYLQLRFVTNSGIKEGHTFRRSLKSVWDVKRHDMDHTLDSSLISDFIGLHTFIAISAIMYSCPTYFTLLIVFQLCFPSWGNQWTKNLARPFF